ncbi:MAG: hypothetical protein HY319_14065 [Armatimonadetes bacterium]|nr:hypothetical protein [Armatimonadota bacterium]
MQAVLALATDRGVCILKPGKEVSEYALHVQAMVESRFATVMLHPNGYLYAGSVGSMAFRSRDGSNWEALYEGLKNNVYSLLGHPNAPDVIYAGTTPAALYKSENAGRSWRRLESFGRVPGADSWTYPEAPYMPRVKALVHHPTMENVLFAGISIGGLVASLDAGATWTERHGGLSRDITSLAIHPDQPGRIYAATNSGFCRSEDLGGTWQRFTQGMPWTFVECVAADSEDPDRLMAAVHQSPQGGGASLFRSTDGGRTWQISYEGLPGMSDRRVTGLHASKGCFFIGTDKGDVFGTSNHGERWQRLGANLPPVRGLCSLA